MTDDVRYNWADLIADKPPTWLADRLGAPTRRGVTAAGEDLGLFGDST